MCAFSVQPGLLFHLKRCVSTVFTQLIFGPAVLLTLKEKAFLLGGDIFVREVKAVVWQSEGCRFDPTLGVSNCP